MARYEPRRCPRLETNRVYDTKEERFTMSENEKVNACWENLLQHFSDNGWKLNADFCKGLFRSLLETSEDKIFKIRETK